MSTKFSRTKRDDREKTAGVAEHVDDDARAGDQQAKARIGQMQWRRGDVIRAREIHAWGVFADGPKIDAPGEKETEVTTRCVYILFLLSLSLLSLVSFSAATFVSVECRRNTDN